MWFDVLGICIGLICLWQGSEIAVGTAKNLADHLGISYTFIGLTILSIGTSLPEIFTNIYAGYQIANGVETSGLAVGTVIGSEVGQITLMLGVAALVGTMRIDKRTLLRDGSMLLIAIAGMVLSGFDGRISRLEGTLLCLAYVLYLIWLARSYATAGPDREPAPTADERPTRTLFALMRIGVGLAILLAGSKLVVDYAIALTTSLGISQSLVGIFVIGLGTSLPELSIAIAGIRRRAGTLSLGSLIGSNITDPMMSLGSGAAIAGFSFDTDLLRFEIPFWLLATLVALGLLYRNDTLGPDDRKPGLLLIALFVVFVAVKLL